jgi:hypothetical protein
MKVINGDFGKKQESSLREKLEYVFEELASDDPGNFIVLVEDNSGELKTATDLPFTDVLYLIEMLKLTMLLDTGGSVNETVH